MRELIDEVQCDRNGYIRLKLKGELVRCGECKHAYVNNRCGWNQYACGENGFIHDYDFYCADGERKEKDDEA